MRRLPLPVAARIAFTVIVAFCVGVAGSALLGGRAVGHQVAADTASRVAATIDETLASQLLGRTLPSPKWGPSGFTRSALTLDAEPPNDGLLHLRRVHQSFMIDGRNLALLTINRGAIGDVQGVGERDLLQLGTATVVVLTKAIFDGTVDVAYYWSRNGLAYTLHVNLVSGIDRTTADRIAQSID